MGNKGIMNIPRNEALRAAYTVLNFSSHPLSNEAIEGLKINLEYHEIREEMIPVNLDLRSPMKPQIRDLVNKVRSVRLDGTEPVFVVFMSVVEAQAYLLAELTGRIGFMPQVVPLRRSDSGVYSLAEWGIQDLQNVLSEAKSRRGYERRKKIERSEE